jgi:hypothetical protein
MNKSTILKKIKESKRRSEKYDSLLLAESERTFRELNSKNMQATLIQVEDFFDSNNLYAFNNWFEGIVWDGPDISRHWIDITLKYPYELMPEPRAMNRFKEMGVKCKFEEDTISVAKKVKNPDDLDPTTRKPKEEEKKIWLVILRIPRHLVDDPLPNETEEPDTVQNIEATDMVNSSEEQSDDKMSEDDEELNADDGSGDDLGL